MGTIQHCIDLEASKLQFLHGKKSLNITLPPLKNEYLMGVLITSPDDLKILCMQAKISDYILNLKHLVEIDTIRYTFILLFVTGFDELIVQ